MNFSSDFLFFGLEKLISLWKNIRIATDKTFCFDIPIAEDAEAANMAVRMMDMV